MSNLRLGGHLGQPQSPLVPSGASPVPEAPAARHLGDLARNEVRWSVYLETRIEGELAQGRVHFVEGSKQRASGWIFREWTERDIVARFNDFSPLELWKLLESLG